MTLGDRIRQLRLERGLSQRALAGEVEVSFPHISKIEAGSEPASNELLAKLAVALGVGPEELMLLARRVPEESAQVVMDKRELAVEFLRQWGDGAITDEDVRRLMEPRRRRS